MEVFNIFVTKKRKQFFGLLFCIYICCYIFILHSSSVKQTQQLSSDKILMDRVIIDNVKYMIKFYKQTGVDLKTKMSVYDVAVSRKKSHHLRIIAITFNRFKSLLRLLNSLNDVIYDNDDVKLEIWIDRYITDAVDEPTLACAENFHFLHGEKSVHVHSKHVGIYGQWLATLDIKDDGKEISVILEDDLTVSKYFYKYLKLVHGKYDDNPNINGYTLQGVSIKHGLPKETWLQGPVNETVFLYPVLGTWGFSPSPANWKAFIKWIMELFIEEPVFVPSVPGNIASSWYKTLRKVGKHDSMWEMWHIYYAWCHKEYTLYSNFGQKLGLTANWMEKGLHYSGNSSGPSNELVTKWKEEYDRLPTTPVRLNVMGDQESKGGNSTVFKKKGLSTCRHK